MGKATRVFLVLAIISVGVAVGSIVRSVVDGTWDLLAWQFVAGAWPVAAIIFVHRQHQITKEN